MQRLYFQCDPATNLADWPDDGIWEEIQARVGELEMITSSPSASGVLAENYVGLPLT